MGANLLAVGALLEVRPRTFGTGAPWFESGTTAGVGACTRLCICGDEVQILLEQEFELFALCFHVKTQSGHRIDDRCQGRCHCGGVGHLVAGQS